MAAHELSVTGAAEAHAEQLRHHESSEEALRCGGLNGRLGFVHRQSNGDSVEKGKTDVAEGSKNFTEYFAFLELIHSDICQTRL